MSSQQRPRQSAPVGPRRGALIWPFVLVALLIGAAMLSQGRQVQRVESVPYSEFRELVRGNALSEVSIQPQRLVGELTEQAAEERDADQVVAVRPEGGLVEGDLIGFLDEHGIAYSAQQRSELQAWALLFLFAVGTIVVFSLFMRRANPAERAMAFGKSRARQYVEREVKITFNDVAGIEEPKAELEEIVDYLRHPEKFRRLGGRIPKGVLLVGSPGTGKTLLARAVAGEAKVPFFSMSGSDFVELFVGVGASRVRDLFRQAEQTSPCIIFIDELDALGKARGVSLTGGGHDEREQTLNQLLVEMDGFEPNINVIIMAATNRPEILDQALLRPGRFDRQVMVPAPDINGREAILKVHVRDKRVAPDLDLRRIASRTPGFVGADLANVVNEAALLAARRGSDYVTFEDFDEAIDRVSIGLERKSHVISEREKRITAYHEAGHAVAASFCEHADPVHKVTIIPRGVTGGTTQFVPREDRQFITKAQLKDLMVVGLAGRVAEEIIFGDISTGAANDIQRITSIARSMVTELGMSERLGPLNYDGHHQRPDPFGYPVNDNHSVSDQTAQLIDDEVRSLVEEAQQRARTILTERRGELEKVAERLLEVEVVDREDLYRLLSLPLPDDPQPDRETVVPDLAMPGDQSAPNG